jgi:hypothetical protein
MHDVIVIGVELLLANPPEQPLHCPPAVTHAPRPQ